MTDHAQTLNDLRPFAERPIVREKELIRQLESVILGKGWIGGSFAAYACSDEETPWLPNDIDIFAVSNEAAEKLALALCDTFSWSFGQLNPVCISLVTLPWQYPVQIVRPNPVWFPQVESGQLFPQVILDDFDLNVCRAAVISPCTVWADFEAGSRIGRVLRVANPLRTLKRVIKYQARGVAFDDWELLKVLKAWQLWSDERQTAECDRALNERRDRLYNSASAEMNEADYHFSDDDDWFEGE